MLEEIAQNLKKYKEEFAQLTMKNNQLKGDIQKVNEKVLRSKTLLTNLSQEKIRWTQIEQGFQSQFQNITGDALISASFLTYCGFYNEQIREFLVSSWRNILKKYFLRYTADFVIEEQLTSFEQKLQRKQNGLPEDNFYSQNALILD